jgi:hypothetical protein
MNRAFENCSGRKKLILHEVWRFVTEMRSSLLEEAVKYKERRRVEAEMPH